MTWPVLVTNSFSLNERYAHSNTNPGIPRKCRTSVTNCQELRLHFLWIFEIYGCFPLCLTSRSETSGTNQGKMEQQFSSKVNFQRDRSVPFTFRLKFRLNHSQMGLKTRIFVNGTARFGRTRPAGQRGPPPAVVPNIPVRPNQNGPFHLTSAQNFWKVWLNGKHPM